MRIGPTRMLAPLRGYDEHMSKEKTQKARLVELEQKVDALTAALWEVTRLTLVSTSDRIPPPETPVALAGLAGITIKLQDGGLVEPPR